MKIIGRIKNMFKKDVLPDTVIEDGYEIKRDGADAPKEIKSKDIVFFELEFSTLNMTDAVCGIEPGEYKYKANLSGESVIVDIKSYPHSAQASRRIVSADNTFLPRVQEIADRFNVAGFNGIYHEVAGLPDFCGAQIFVCYASGEKITAFDNQDMFLDIEMLLEYKKLFESVLQGKCEA